MEHGCFQIVLDTTFQGFTGPAGGFVNYPIQLSGNYKLTLKSAQIHIYPEITEANTISIEIYSPNFLFKNGLQLYPTLLYPRAANNSYQANLDIDLYVSLNSNIQLQIRNASTKANIPDLRNAILTFYYEKIY